jgi:cellulose synthase/poly-beta-1,6-N-acetylglucosamine synthase-like glycosyltransferase
MDMQLSFITLSFNSEKFLSKCFDSIISKCEEEEMSFEIIVIDNGSKDGSLNIINDYAGKYKDNFKTILLPKNRGTTFTRNLGLKKARGKYICIIDSDTEILDGSLKDITDILENNEEIGIVAPRLSLPDGNIQNSVKKFPTFWQKITKIPRPVLKIGLPNIDFYENFPFKNTRFVDSAISACWFLSKDLLSIVGLFDENIFYAPEDLDFCLRLQKVNKKIAYFPNVKILHHTQQISHRNPFSKLAISHLLGLLYYFRKHGGWFSVQCANQEKKRKNKPVFLILSVVFCLFIIGFIVIDSMLLFELTFWFSVLFICLTTYGYPLVIYFVSMFKKEAKVFMDTEPTVSLIISAHNEAKTISAKLENSLQLDYPKEKLEIIVASDGSTDGTNEIVASFQDRDIKLFDYERAGKTGTQNKAVKEAKGEIIVFSDANSIYNEDALKKLIRNFGNGNIGCVCGQLVYKDRGSHVGFAEGFYWDYEKKLKEYESRISSLIGANGAIYAIRKELYIEIGDHLISDLIEPLEIYRKGKRVVYEPEAVSFETSSLSYEEEFKRKVRILTRSIQGILYMKDLFNPLRYGIFAFQILIHKLFRYLVPVFLITGFISLIFLAHNVFYFTLLCTTLIYLVFAGIGKVFENKLKNFRLFNLCYYYLMVNYAVILSWMNIIRGKKFLIWAPRR